MKKIIKLFIILSSYLSYGQYSPTEFEKFYKEVTLGKTNNTDINNNLEEVHLLLDSSKLKTNVEKLKAYLILANLYNFKADYTKSIKYAEEGRKLAFDKKLYLWESRFYGFKSSVYRKSEMYFLGEEELTKGLESAKKAYPTEDLYRFKANAYHEMAHYASAKGRFKDAIREMQESSIWASKINDSTKFFFLASNYQYLGILYNRMNKPDSAILFLNKSLSLTNNNNINSKTLKNYVFNYIGEAYLKKNKNNYAKIYFDSVSRSNNKYRTIELNQELYNNLTTYYEQTNNLDSTKVYRNKFDSITRVLVNRKAEAINNVTSKLSQANEKLEMERHPYLWLIFVCFIGFVSLFISLKRKIKKKEKGLDVMPSASKNEELNIAKDTLISLEEKLNVFEKEKQFLEINITTTQLANQFQTNTKYVTYVIKKLYNQDFNTYINTLRIEYVSKLINDDIKYRQYKISYLAEISGFSSHSKFAAVFKKIKGSSPSEYIQKINESEKNNTQKAN